MMTPQEIIDRENLECFLYEKLKSAYGEDTFFIKDESAWKEDEIVDYSVMIEVLADVVEQHMWDNEITLDQLDEIDSTQWDKWVSEYEMPEEGCTCSRGCKDCLMTEW